MKWQYLFKVELPPSDLSPPRTLNETLYLLQNIFDCQGSSILSSEDRNADLVQVDNVNLGKYALQWLKHFSLVLFDVCLTHRVNSTFARSFALQDLLHFVDLSNYISTSPAWWCTG